MNELDPKNVIIYKSLKKKRNKYSDQDFKKQTEIEIDSMSLLAIERFFHDSWCIKYKRPRVLFYLILLVETGYVLGHNYFIHLNNKKVR